MSMLKVKKKTKQPKPDMKEKDEDIPQSKVSHRKTAIDYAYEHL